MPQASEPRATTIAYIIQPSYQKMISLTPGFHLIKMARSKEMAPTMRARICELSRDWPDYKCIQKAYPEIPFATISF
ncbi:hypothetical protein BO71DRAFT_398528 [Aspergillus ellipticus CBS 707.79]|uniref:Uncharacterized protein n=1 Tax=Aspergillus ellipticus CBS 707.79 TaxID=1448320 RepID=A0A319DCF7_9EURO|nr:hypothetical protein BO71DRAFT_398528 [Aspergillus ellipticus CBS 707.79]